MSWITDGNPQHEGRDFTEHSCPEAPNLSGWDAYCQSCGQLELLGRR